MSVVFVKLKPNADPVLVRSLVSLEYHQKSWNFFQGMEATYNREH